MTKCRTILLVDRDEDLLKELTSHCRAIGLAVLSAREGAAAARLIEENPPDLICVDDQMPGGDGLTLCEMILASPDDVSCPVIVLTQRIGAPRKPASEEMCVYLLRKRAGLWRYLEPVIEELIDIPPRSRRLGDHGRGESPERSDSRIE